MSRPHHKTTLHLAALLLLSLLLPCVGHSQTDSQPGYAKIEVILIEATNQGTGIDQKLAPYAPNLKRLFRFDSYQQIQSSQLQIPLPGTQKLALKNATSLEIEIQKAPDTLHTFLNWQRGKSSLLSTKLHLKRGTPAVLGGPKSPNGNYLLIINWK